MSGREKGESEDCPPSYWEAIEVLREQAQQGGDGTQFTLASLTHRPDLVADFSRRCTDRDRSLPVARNAGPSPSVTGTACLENLRDDRKVDDLFIQCERNRPAALNVEENVYVIGVDKTQTEIKWQPPENADQFSRISYLVQMLDGSNSDSASEDWVDVFKSTLPIFRVYRTDDTILLGQRRMKNVCTDSRGDVVFTLRVRADGILRQGTTSRPEEGSWSSKFSIRVKKNWNRVGFRKFNGLRVNETASNERRPIDYPVVTS